MAAGDKFQENFQPGDVIYGLAKTRHAYIDALIRKPEIRNLQGRHSLSDLESNGLYLTVDDFNDRTFGAAAPCGSDAPDTTVRIQGNLRYNRSAAAGFNESQRAVAQKYYSLLQDSKFAPLEAVTESNATLLRKGAQRALTNAGTPEFRQGEPVFRREELVFRRACKFGLEFIIEHMNSTIHFVLDRNPILINSEAALDAHADYDNMIESEHIVSKTRYNGREPVKASEPAYTGYIPITTSELRCCYRNREKWITPDGRLRFYYNFVEVSPPWVLDPTAWAIYEMHRKRKGKLGLMQQATAYLFGW